MWRLPHLWVDGWVDIWVRSCQINLDLIEIIQFCVKIYDLWRLPHLWVVGGISWCMGVVMSNF